MNTLLTTTLSALGLKSQLEKAKEWHSKQSKTTKGLILLGGIIGGLYLTKKTIVLTNRRKETGKLSSRKNYL